GQFRAGNLATESRWGLLTPPVPGPKWAEDIMKAHNTGGEAIVLPVVQTQALRHELFPTIGILRLRRVGVLFFQWGDIGVGLQIFWINTGRRSVEITLDTVEARRFQGVHIYEGVVPEDLRVVR